MKIITKEEEAAHYNATVKGGAIGGGMGLLVVSTSFPSLKLTRHQTVSPIPIPDILEMLPFHLNKSSNSHTTRAQRSSMAPPSDSLHSATSRSP
jgi:hypothetical protein